MKIKQWYSRTVNSETDLHNMIQVIKENEILAGAFDTETTGLNIIHDKPFLYICGLVTPQNEGFIWIVNLKKQPIANEFIKEWHLQASKFPVYLAHNTKFDLHMMINHGLPYIHGNISDTMFYIRYATDAIPQRFGGAPLALKRYTSKYLLNNANAAEKQIREARSSIARNYNSMLRARLTRIHANYKKVIDYLEDTISDINEMPIEIIKAFQDWIMLDLPSCLRKEMKYPHPLSFNDIPYNLVDSKLMYKYAELDVLYTLEIWLQLNPILEERGNQEGLRIENDLIYPLLKMERVGLKINKSYLEGARSQLKQLILNKRKQFTALAKVPITCGQHKEIKTVLKNNWNIELDKVDDDTLEPLVGLLPQNSDELEFIKILIELRTLEKWYATYVMKFLKDVDQNNKIYTTLLQVGAASGRFSSDFQQFPKGEIKNLYNPRQMIMPENTEYDMVFIDYSQIELRVQAMYTILVGNADLNLCRAYMPYKCVNNQGESFDPTNQQHLKDWSKEWFYEENRSTTWSPTDVHGVTTEIATGLRPDDPAFKTARSDIGKRLNFAKNYGAGRSRVRLMFPNKTEDEITRIDNAYYQAYPGIKTYHDYCFSRANTYGSTTNLFGVKYYGTTGHKLRNLLIQGSSAYLLKLKIIEINQYLIERKLKTKMQLQIHDEIMFIWHKDEYSHLPKIKEIMENWPGALVPIIAECSKATTNWANKEDLNV